MTVLQVKTQVLHQVVEEQQTHHTHHQMHWTWSWKAEGRAWQSQHDLIPYSQILTSQTFQKRVCDCCYYWCFHISDVWDASWESQVEFGCECYCWTASSGTLPVKTILQMVEYEAPACWKQSQLLPIASDLLIYSWHLLKNMYWKQMFYILRSL